MKKAIIVDDEKPSIELIEYVLNSYNLPLTIVDTCSNGRDALLSIYKNLPEIVFIDIEMPKMNGLDVIENTNRNLTKKIDFIIITAYDKFEYAQKALRLGAKDILLKPIDIDILLKIVEPLLDFTYTGNDLLDDILKSISKNYLTNISLQEVAINFSTSSSYIAKLFSKYLNTSFISYLNSKKINYSIKLLLDTDKSIQEIAGISGFNNLNHFYNTFKKITNTTPKEYRDLYMK